MLLHNFSDYKDNELIISCTSSIYKDTLTLTIYLNSTHAYYQWRREGAEIRKLHKQFYHYKSIVYFGTEFLFFIFITVGPHLQYIGPPLHITQKTKFQIDRST